MNKCVCEWCNRKQVQSGRGYCRRHYDQIREYGYVLDIRTSFDDNRINIKDGYAEIVLTDGKDNVQGIAKISIEDVEKIKGHHWSDNGNGYVRCFEGTTPIYLHRYIMDCPDDMEVDHINHDKRDNRRCNLRNVSHSINARNHLRDCIRKIEGRQLARPYLVRIIKDGSLFYCKYFKTYEEAFNASKRVREEIAEL